jgi:hypothetical protein
MRDSYTTDIAALGEKGRKTRGGKRMKKRGLGITGLAAIGAALVLSGCGGNGSSSRGGGKSLTKEEFAAKANAICATYLLKTSALANTTNEAEAVQLMVDVRALYAKSIADMKKLEPPAAERATVDRAVTLSEQQLGTIDQEIAALRKRDTAAVTKAVGRSKTINKESNSVFSRLGAASCTR